LTASPSSATAASLARFTARRRQLALDVAERKPDRDQALLGPVVEISLEAPPFLIPGGDDALPRLLDLCQPARDFRTQSSDLDRKPGRVDHALQ
jgi:hypothetical protein